MYFYPYCPLLITGGALGAAGCQSCFNYKRTAASSIRILGKELGNKKSFLLYTEISRHSTHY